MEEEKKTIKDKEEEIKKKEKKIASNIKAEAEEIDKSLSEVIRQQATEDEAPQSRTFSLRKILGGDVLSTSFMRRQVWLCVLIALFIVVYICRATAS